MESISNAESRMRLSESKREFKINGNMQVGKSARARHSWKLKKESVKGREDAIQFVAGPTAHENTSKADFSGKDAAKRETST